jgi:hypothetical protein
VRTCLYYSFSRTSQHHQVFCHRTLYRLGLIRTRFDSLCFVVSGLVTPLEVLISVLKFPCRLGESDIPFVGSRVALVSLCLLSHVTDTFLSLSNFLGSLDVVSFFCQEVLHARALFVFSASRRDDHLQNSNPVFVYAPCYWTTSACFQRNMPGTGLRVLQLPPRGARRDLRPDFG